MCYDLIRWLVKSRRLPLPFLLKRKILLGYIKKYKLKTFMETGTCYGDMLAGLKNYVEQAISIEIDETLYQNAQNRFHNCDNVKIIFGDSAKILPSLLDNLDAPTLFYLDAHYSGPGTGMGDVEAPLLNELKTLLNTDIKNHIILIDDARHLGSNNYPTLEEIKNLFKQTALVVRNDHDIVRIST